MNYYKRHIGDYAAATRHLSMLEHGAYTMLLDTYYTSEAALPADVKAAARKAGARSKDEVAAVEVVLAEFFTLQADGWHNGRCDEEIGAFQAKAGANRVNGKGGGRPKKKPNGNPDGFEDETQMVSRNGGAVAKVETLTTNHKPLTINQGALVEHQQAGADGFGPVGPARAGFENPGSDAGSGPGSAAVLALAAEAAGAMRSAGLADVSETHPRLVALIRAGMSVAELADAARAAVAARVDKGFPWALARAEGQRRDAASVASLPDAVPTGPALDPDSRAAIEADGVRLGLGRWAAVDDRTGEAVLWSAYAARVKAARVEEAAGVAA